MPEIIISFTNDELDAIHEAMVEYAEWGDDEAIISQVIRDKIIKIEE